MRSGAVVAGLFLVALAGCDGNTAINGVVVDPEGKPVRGASVRMTHDMHASTASETSTGEDGRFFVGFTHIPSGHLTVTATKDGYKPFTATFKPGDVKSHPTRIVLEPEPNAGGKP